MKLKETFKDKCEWAYRLILERRHDLKVRFKVMVDAGIPELKEKDLLYLDTVLGLDKRNKDWEYAREDVVQRFKDRLKDYMQNGMLSVKLNFVIHDINKKLKSILQ